MVETTKAAGTLNRAEVGSLTLPQLATLAVSYAVAMAVPVLIAVLRSDHPALTFADSVAIVLLLRLAPGARVIPIFVLTAVAMLVLIPFGGGVHDAIIQGVATIASLAPAVLILSHIERSPTPPGEIHGFILRFLIAGLLAPLIASAIFALANHVNGVAGTAIWHEFLADLLAGAGGAFVVLVIDAVIGHRVSYESAREIADARVAAAEDRWTFALADARQATWDINYRTGRGVRSKGWFTMLGYQPEELSDTIDLWLDLMHPDDRPMAIEAERALRRGEIQILDIEFRMRHKAGRWVWVGDRGRVVAWDADGQPIRAIGTHTDITESRLIAAEKAVISERMRLAVEAAGVGLFEMRLPSGDIWWDERMHSLHGTDPATFQPSREAWCKLLHPDDAARASAEFDLALEGRGIFDTEFRIIHRGGEVRHVRAIARLHRMEHDGTQRLIGTNWDITAEREVAERLFTAVDNVNQFAAIASHDLQAPLRQISLWIDIILHETPDTLTPEQHELLDKVRRRSQHMRTLVAGMMEFARTGSRIRFQVFGLDDVIAAAVEEYAMEIGAIGAAVNIRPLPQAYGDPLMTGQLFRNLISNALKYRGSEPLNIDIYSRSEPGYVLVYIEDNGIGVDPAYARTIFEIFQRLPSSTAREGSGIGLALCRRIATALGGDIHLDTSKESGSIFVVKLKAPPGASA